jgi:hypothetical protein
MPFSRYHPISPPDNHSQVPRWIEVSQWMGSHSHLLTSFFFSGFSYLFSRNTVFFFLLPHFGIDKPNGPHCLWAQ